MSSPSEQLEQLEKQEKELEESIRNQKAKIAELDRKKLTLQNICDKLQLNKAEFLDRSKKTKRNQRKSSTGDTRRV
jgi:prefoldin subunit 5